MQSISPSLRVWFVIHFVADMIFGVPLLLIPGKMLQMFGFPSDHFFFARLVGAALIGIGGSSFLARNAPIEVFRALLELKILWSVAAIFGILLSIYNGAPKSAWMFLAIFCFFSSAWITFRYKLR